MAQKQKVKYEQDGNISYKKAVVVQIVELAAKEIAGVATLCTKRTSSFKNLFNRNFKKGVVLNFDDTNGVKVQVYVIMNFGFAVNEVAFRVQENVKRSIESMTEFKVKRIDVNIVGVNFDMLEDFA